MATYFISYDLNRPGQRYPELDKALEKIGAGRVLETVWLVNTALTAAQVRDVASPHLDQNDKLLVMAVGTWAAFRLPQNWVDWLQKNAH